MITRIVKMKFKAEHVNDFIALFQSSAPVIRTFDGCLHVELISDIHHPQIMCTLSKWTSEESLNHYRNSSFFLKTWTETKKLFQEKAEAWSFVEIK